jgi:hypothetical protein
LKLVILYLFSFCIKKLKEETDSMEVAALAGLLGLGFMVSKTGQKKKQEQQPIVEEIPSSHLTPPMDHTSPLFPNQAVREGFLPARNGLRGDAAALPTASKGASATGFGPELDMMYQTPNGHTYPSEPSSGPYGSAFGYASNQPPYAPGFIPGTAPSPSPIESNIPMTEYRSDNTESSPNYMDSEYVISPLSGQRIPSTEYKHNNMQPFFGGRIKQNIAPQSNTSVLDMYNGSGSTQLKKREVENMFESSRAPYGNPHGMEDNTDFFQSRISSQAPVVRNGERPFEPTRVGAGLNDKFGMNGKGGFQQLDINEIMRPKDTNDLRVLSNPKETFSTPMVPGQHFIGSNAELKDVGEVRKYKPDTFYIDESGERYFTTTGDVIKETVRSAQVMPHTTRPETSVEYSGSASSQDFGESYVTGSYRAPMGQQHGGAGYRNADMTGYYTKDTDADKADYGKSAIEIRPNERVETSERVMALNAVPAENGLVMSRYSDESRPTRRSETIGNIRMTGTPHTHVDRAAAITVWDPKDIARTTVKESTIYLDRMGIMAAGAAPERLKVYDPDDIAKRTQKEQIMNNSSWMGPGGNGAWSDAMDNTAAYNMRSNPNKEQIARGRKPIAGAGTSATFNGDPGRQLSKKLDADIMNDRALAVNRSVDITPGVGDIGRVEYRVPLKMDVSRERNSYSSIEAVESNPLMQSLRKNAEIDEAAIREYRQYLSSH